MSTIPCNLGSSHISYPFAYVMNSDDSSGPGRHWCAIYAFSEKMVEFFDPAGLPPNKCQSKFLANFETVKQSTTQLQSPYSSVCGHYSIYFIIRRCYGDSFENIIKRLDLMGENRRDSFVREYVNQLEQCLHSEY